MMIELDPEKKLMLEFNLLFNIIFEKLKKPKHSEKNDIGSNYILREIGLLPPRCFGRVCK